MDARSGRDEEEEVGGESWKGIAARRACDWDRRSEKSGAFNIEKTAFVCLLHGEHDLDLHFMPECDAQGAPPCNDNSQRPHKHYPPTAGGIGDMKSLLIRPPALPLCKGKSCSPRPY